MEAAKEFDKFLRGEPATESGGSVKEADVGTDFFGLLDNVLAADDGGAVGGLEDGSEHAKRGGFAGSVGAEKTVNLAGLAGEADVIDGADFTALLVLEALGQGSSFNHHRTPSWEFVRQVTEGSQCTTRGATKCYGGGKGHSG